jgi:pimeloyl-ACP methyl ester carboxylesterase
LGEQQAHLIGHDWGGVIACVAGAQAPERFCSLTIIAAPHIARATAIIRYVPRQMLLSWYIMFFQLRGISAAAVRRNNWSLLRKLWKNWAPGYQLPEAEWELMLKQFDQPGVLKAALSYYRQNASPGVFLGWRHLGLRPLQSIPVRSLVIAGIDDGCFDQRIYDYVFSRNDFPEALRVVKIDGVGHFPHQEAPQQINSMLLDWLG